MQDELDEMEKELRELLTEKEINTLDEVVKILNDPDPNGIRANWQRAIMLIDTYPLPENTDEITFKKIFINNLSRRLLPEEEKK